MYYKKFKNRYQQNNTNANLNLASQSINNGDTMVIAINNDNIMNSLLMFNLFIHLNSNNHMDNHMYSRMHNLMYKNTVNPTYSLMDNHRQHIFNKADIQNPYTQLRIVEDKESYLTDYDIKCIFLNLYLIFHEIN